jgi:hypothetical protein
MRMVRGNAEGRLGLDRELRACPHHQAQAGLQIVQNPVRFEEDVRIPAQHRPQIMQQERKIGFGRRILEGRCRQQGAARSRGQVARRIGRISRRSLFPDRFVPAVGVAGDLDGSPVELGQGSDQAAHQRGLAHAPTTSAYDDDRHQG